MKGTSNIIKYCLSKDNNIYRMDKSGDICIKELISPMALHKESIEKQHYLLPGIDSLSCLYIFTYLYFPNILLRRNNRLFQ